VTDDAIATIRLDHPTCPLTDEQIARRLAICAACNVQGCCPAKRALRLALTGCERFAAIQEGGGQ
jgi:hypothetical protein